MSAPADDPTEELAIFPLENVVLLPRVRVPLHIFEPRYRQMTRDALEGSKRIGMVCVMPSESQEMRGQPAVFPIGCAGTITQSEELEDGRFKILLQGDARFRIVEEAKPEGDRLYRVATVTALADEYPESDRAAVRGLRTECIGLLREWLLHASAPRAEQTDESTFAGVEDETLVNALTQSLDFRPIEKQGLVEADRVVDRYRRLVGLMRFRLAELGGTGGSDPGSVH